MENIIYVIEKDRKALKNKKIDRIENNNKIDE